MHTAAEFERLAGVLATSRQAKASIRALFDWSRLEFWQFDLPTLGMSTEWAQSGQRFERVAILHHHCWNRQAAWLGAVLRLNRAEVRSYRPEDINKANNWLKVDIPSVPHLYSRRAGAER